MLRTPSLAACALAAVACGGAAGAPPAVANPSSGAAPGPPGAASAPPEATYEVQPGWPTLPPGVVLGQAAGVAVDAQNRVYVFHRAGRGFHNDTIIAAPTVLVLDGPTGRLLAQWGAGRFLVPHGIAADADGNLWLTDVGLDRVFKFSPEGRELLSIGRGR